MRTSTSAARSSRLLVATLALWARSATARDVSFRDARATAARAAPDIAIAEGRADVAGADVQVAGALVNPTVGVTTARETAKLGVSLAVPVPLFGQRAASLRAAEATAAAVGLEVAVVRSGSVWAATLAWIDLWEAQERVAALAIAAADAERLLQVAGDRFQSGAGPRLDEVRARAERARAAADLELGRHLVDAAGARLAPWLADDDDTSRATAVAAPDFPPHPPPLDALERRLSEHPVLAADRAQVAALQAHIDGEKRLRWPVVTPQLIVNQGDPTLPGTDVIAGVSLDVPVLSVRGGAIARANAERALAQTIAAADERRLRSDLRDAYHRATGARARLDLLTRDSAPAIAEAKRMTDEGYQLGRLDLLHVLDAARALRESRLAEAEAVASWARAMADLEKAAGVDLAAGGAGGSTRAR